MSVDGIKKITIEDIEKLNENNAIYKSKDDKLNGNSTTINTSFFGDNGEIYLDHEGRIIEKLNNGQEVYMGWADKDKLNNNQVHINSAYDYFEKFPEKNNGNLVNGRLNKPSGNTFNKTITNIEVNDTPIIVDRSAIDNNNKKDSLTFQEALNNVTADIYDFFKGDDSQTKVSKSEIEVDRSAIDNNMNVFASPIVVDRSAIDKIENNIDEEKTTEKHENNISVGEQNFENVPEEVADNDIEDIENFSNEENDTYETVDIDDITPEETANNNVVDENFTVFAQNALEEMNQKRREYGLPDLIWSSELAQAAIIRATEASQNWSHTRPNGEQYNTVSDQVMGENLAKNYPDAFSTVEAWMNSDSHRANILDKDLRTVGIAMIETADGQNFCAADFSEYI